MTRVPVTNSGFRSPPQCAGVSYWDGQTGNSEGIIAGPATTPASYEGQSKTNRLEMIKDER